MHAIGFSLIFAVLASAFSIGFAATQFPTETFFTAFVAIVAVIGIGVSLFFLDHFFDDPKKHLKPLGASAAVLLIFGVALIFAYRSPTTKAHLIGSWSSETVLSTAMGELNAVGSAACTELLKRDRLTAIRAMSEKPAYSQSQCLAGADASFRRSVLVRWDERLMSSKGTPAYANAIQKFAADFPDLAPHMLFDCSISSQSKKAQARCVELSANYDPSKGFAQQFAWWSRRPSLSARFTEAFAKSAEGPMNNRLTRRILLRQVCTQPEGSEVDDVFNGWLRHISCAQNSRGNISGQVCSSMPDELDASQKITAEGEVCKILRKDQNEADKIRAKVDAAEAERNARINSAVLAGSGGGSRPSLDEFLNTVRDDPNAISDFSASDIKSLIGEMEATQLDSATAELNKFSSEGRRQRKIEKVMEDLRNKPGMQQFFDDEGEIDQDSLLEKAKELGR